MPRRTYGPMRRRPHGGDPAVLQRLQEELDRRRHTLTPAHRAPTERNRP